MTELILGKLKIVSVLKTLQELGSGNWMNSGELSMKNARTKASIICMLFLVWILMAANGFSHCDGLDGPVIIAARKALETGNVKLVLVWVQQGDEAEIRSAFEKTLAARKMNPSARELADTSFFETLVRIHRAGEGFPYTGIKPAGRDLGPAIPAADKAIEKGSSEPLLQLLIGNMREGLTARYQEVLARSRYDVSDVAAGREFVKAYVTYIHYIEQLYESAKGPKDGHGHDLSE